MKKFYLLILPVLMTLHSFCQPAIGIKGGFTIPSITGSTENVTNYVSGTNFNAGFVYSQHLKNEWYLLTELNYAPQSAWRKGVQPLTNQHYANFKMSTQYPLYANYRHELRFTFVELPVMLQLKIGEKLKYSISMGPQMAFLTHATSSSKGESLLYLNAGGTMINSPEGTSPTTRVFNEVLNVTSNYRRIIFGFQGGLQLEYPVLNGTAFIQTRTIIGLTNLNKSSITTEKLYTGSLAISAGVLIDLPRNMMQRDDLWK